MTTTAADDLSTRLVTTYGISRRSAMRHIKAGTEPHPARCDGRDGKRYPRHKRTTGPSTVLMFALKIARSNVRRAAGSMDVGFYPFELAVLREIHTELSDLLSYFPIETGCIKSNLTETEDAP